jgi:regulator of sirC expression with transglutaminase-like and TPR domain
LGYAYLNKGEYQKAINSLKKFLELAPENPEAENIKNLIPSLEKLIKQ